jgi:hypothetical protein
VTELFLLSPKLVDAATPDNRDVRNSQALAHHYHCRQFRCSQLNLSGWHSLEFPQRGINRVPRMAADGVCDRLRLELARVVKAGRVDRYQLRHRDECQVDRRPAGRAEGVELFVPAVGRYPPVPRFARNAHVGSPGEDQIGSVPGAASLLTIATLAVALDDGFAARLIMDRAAGTSAGIFGHGPSPAPD